MRGLSIILALGALAAVPAPVLAQHEGHAMPAPVPPPADPHAGHTAPVVATATPGPVDQQAWPENAADAVWGESVMAAARGHFYGDHTMVSQKIAVEQLEVLSGDGPLRWQADAEGYRFSRREGSRWVDLHRDDLLRPQHWRAAGITVQPRAAIELSAEWIGVPWELALSLDGRQLRLRDDGSGQLQVVQ